MQGQQTHNSESDKNPSKKKKDKRQWFDLNAENLEKLNIEQRQQQLVLQNAMRQQQMQQQQLLQSNKNETRHIMHYNTMSSVPMSEGSKMTAIFPPSEMTNATQLTAFTQFTGGVETDITPIVNANINSNSNSRNAESTQSPPQQQQQQHQQKQQQQHQQQQQQQQYEEERRGLPRQYSAPASSYGSKVREEMTKHNNNSNNSNNNNDNNNNPRMADESENNSEKNEKRESQLIDVFGEKEPMVLR